MKRCLTSLMIRIRKMPSGKFVSKPQWGIASCVTMCLSKTNTRTSLVVQWECHCLPMQGTQVLSLVWEDSTCHGSGKPMCHNCWSSHALELTFHSKRSHHNEKPVHCTSEKPLLTQLQKVAHSNKDSEQQNNK